MFLNTLNKYKIYNLTDYNLKMEKKYIKKTLKRTLKKENIKGATFNLIIVNNDYIRSINKTYRNIDKETDVISFALLDEEKCIPENELILGDIYISIDKAKTQAKEYNHSLVRELCFLSVHGLLHLLGYDHMNKEDEEIMFGKQELILDGQRFTSIKEK